MDYTEILGFGAALLTTISNIPQALKIIKTKDTKGVSAPTYFVLLAGLVLWVAYGIFREDLPLVIANSISASICAVVLFLKLTSKKVLENIHDTVHEN